MLNSKFVLFSIVLVYLNKKKKKEKPIIVLVYSQYFFIKKKKQKTYGDNWLARCSARNQMRKKQRRPAKTYSIFFLSSIHSQTVE